MLSDVWDLDAGYLAPQHLNEYLQYLGALLGMTQVPGQTPPLPPRWRGHRDALVVRYNQVLAELNLRQVPVPAALPLPEDAILWPVSFSAVPSAQLARIREMNERGQRGRLGAPKNEHELWAQYKYSVLARNHEAYRNFGQLVAARAIAHEDLLLELIHSARVVPTLGGLRNAVYHMWGYVSAHSSRNPNQTDLAMLMTEIQQLAQEHKVSYLLNSTALGELGYWCRYYVGLDNAAKPGKGGRSGP